jgi:Glycosyl transferases group 1
MRLITLATPATLPQARVLARSLALHQPGWPLEVVLLAGEGAVAAAMDPRDSLPVRSLAAELDVDVERLMARHEEADLVVLLLPRLLERVIEREAGAVVHLPPSAWVLGSLGPISEALESRPVLLAPRASADLPADGLGPSPEQLERAGRIDETIIGVDGSAAARGFLRWWSGHVEAVLGSLDGAHVGGRPEDRPWLARRLELAPARFATAVLDQPGCNLSMWNLHARTLQREGEEGNEILLDGEFPVSFLNLPGFEPDRPHRLSAIAGRVRVSRSPVLRQLLVTYAEELRAAGWQDADLRRQVGRRLADGVVYDDSLRALYGRAWALGEHSGELFSERGTEAFTSWLAGPAPEGGALGVTRYVYYRVAHERPDVLRAYPDLDGADGPGYVAWCRAFGQEELTIPERFMPPRPGEPVREEPPAPEAPSVNGLGARTEGARSARRSAAEAAPGDGLAVRVSGYLGHTLGLGSAARGYVEALGAAGVPVSTLSVPLDHLALPAELAAGYGRQGFEDLVHHGRHGFEIVAVNADELPDFVERLGVGYFEGPRIGIWGWETNSIPVRWRRAFDLVDEIWVYSRFMAENIGAVAPVPVRALAPPVKAPDEPAAPVRLGVGEGFLFLFVFDYLSTIQRKNPVGLVEAFRRAFAPGEGPRLLIKTINAPLRPLAEEEVLWAAEGRPDIHVIDRSLSGEELAGLMAGCDCYVSLHRAEGFGLTIAEAMSIGKPVIATGYSGNVDFMDAENSWLVDYEIARVGPECEIYPPEGEWAEPSVAHAAQLMREVHDSPEEAALRGTRAAEDIARSLSPRATGAAMRLRLEELSR